jgi:hypothetical protein
MNNWEISKETASGLREMFANQTEEDRRGILEFAEANRIPNIEIVKIVHLPEIGMFKFTVREI